MRLDDLDVEFRVAGLRAAMRTSSCATATPIEVLGATSTAMSRDALATRASNSAS